MQGRTGAARRRGGSSRDRRKLREKIHILPIAVFSAGGFARMTPVPSPARAVRASREPGVPHFQRRLRRVACPDVMAGCRCQPELASRRFVLLQPHLPASCRDLRRPREMLSPVSAPAAGSEASRPRCLRVQGTAGTGAWLRPQAAPRSATTSARAVPACPAPAWSLPAPLRRTRNPAHDSHARQTPGQSGARRQTLIDPRRAVLLHLRMAQLRLRRQAHRVRSRAGIGPRFGRWVALMRAVEMPFPVAATRLRPAFVHALLLRPHGLMFRTGHQQDGAQAEMGDRHQRPAPRLPHAHPLKLPRLTGRPQQERVLCPHVRVAGLRAHPQVRRRARAPGVPRVAPTASTGRQRWTAPPATSSASGGSGAGGGRGPAPPGCIGPVPRPRRFIRHSEDSRRPMIGRNRPLLAGTQKHCPPAESTGPSGIPPARGTDRNAGTKWRSEGWNSASPRDRQNHFWVSWSCALSGAAGSRPSPGEPAMMANEGRAGWRLSFASGPAGTASGDNASRGASCGDLAENSDPVTSGESAGARINSRQADAGDRDISRPLKSSCRHEGAAVREWIHRTGQTESRIFQRHIEH